MHTRPFVAARYNRKLHKARQCLNYCAGKPERPPNNTQNPFSHSQHRWPTRHPHASPLLPAVPTGVSSSYSLSTQLSTSRRKQP